MQNDNTKKFKNLIRKNKREIIRLIASLSHRIQSKQAHNNRND